VRTIAARELMERPGYSRPHTVHCGPDIYVTAMGNEEAVIRVTAALALIGWAIYQRFYGSRHGCASACGRVWRAWRSGRS
jgi:hypothetical protein